MSCYPDTPMSRQAGFAIGIRSTRAVGAVLTMVSHKRIVQGQSVVDQGGYSSGRPLRLDRGRPTAAIRAKHYAFLRKPRRETKRAMMKGFSKN